MIHLPVNFFDAAVDDLADAWSLVATNDGPIRADRLVARIEAFCNSIGSVRLIGTARDDLMPGIRTVGVPGLTTAVVVFAVTSSAVNIVRIGYLGRNVTTDLPSLSVDDPIDVAKGNT